MASFSNLEILPFQALARGGFLPLSILTCISCRNVLQYTFRHTYPQSAIEKRGKTEPPVYPHPIKCPVTA